MDNLLTQGLIGLVFVLSVALWSKSSSSSTSTSKDASASQKSKKKKKKGNAVSSSSEVPAAHAASKATVQPAKEEPPPTTTPLKSIEESKASKKPQQNGNSNGNKKAPSAASRKKMTLEDFVAKTNEERVEELERGARGDAGEKDPGSDMIDKDLQPEIPYKKTARIEPAASRVIHSARSADDGWENVGGKAKIAQPVVASTKSNKEVPSNAWASSNPFALLPGSGAEPVRAKSSASPKIASNFSAATAAATAAAQAQTKKQRQNAAKIQAKKAEKEAMEAERLARLAQHKKQVESERMKEQFKKQSPVSAPFSVHQNGNGKSKAASSLPKASINEKGSLVWD